MAWAAACCRREEASPCCCKGSLTTMTDGGAPESKWCLILRLNSQLKVWHDTRPWKKQICRKNSDSVWSLHDFSIMAISRLPPLLSPYLLPADIFQHLAFSPSCTYKTSTSTEPNTEAAGLLKSQSSVDKVEKPNIGWSHHGMQKRKITQLRCWVWQEEEYKTLVLENTETKTWITLCWVWYNRYSSNAEIFGM